MYRNIINDLASWFQEPKRKILNIKGATGVGKTWTIRDFATGFFDAQLYFDIPKQPEIAGLLSDECGLSEEERIRLLDAYLSEYAPDFVPEKTLLIFDGLQSIPNCAYFFYTYAKKHRNYNLCMISDSMQISEYEYHYVDVFRILRMRPMSFEEYMIANKANPLIAAIENHKSTPLNPMELRSVTNMLRDYMLVGGMPGIVHAFLKNKDYDIIRPMQRELLAGYDALIKRSFSYARAERCRRIWRSIPKQLTHENKKFMYHFVDENARAREYREAVQGLCDLGLARMLPRLKDGTLPLEEHIDMKSFELFCIDHGLLRAIYDLPIDRTLSLEQLFAECDGGVAEQFIFEELSAKVGYLYYWVSGATARVPFVYEGEQGAIPVDIRFSPNNKAQNIKTFRAKNPNTKISLKISLEPISIDASTLNIPAYGLWNM